MRDQAAYNKGFNALSTNEATPEQAMKNTLWAKSYWAGKSDALQNRINAQESCDACPDTVRSPTLAA